MSLPAGTYYLTIVSDPGATSGTQNVSDGNGTPVLGNGVSIATTGDEYFAEPGTGIGSIDDSFPPASSFFFFGRDENGGRMVVQVQSVVLPPTIQKQFGVATLPEGRSTSLSFTITNPNTNATTGGLTGIGFTDNLTGGMFTPSGEVTGSCGGGTITAMPGGSVISLSGAALAAGASCTLSFLVASVTSGEINNSATVSSTDGGTGNTAIASLLVVAPPSIQKSFGAATIPLNGITSLNFVVNNPNSATSLTGVGFTDTLPAGLVVATPNGLTGSCGGGTITASGGSSSVSLSGATLSSASCTFSVNVTGTTAGAKNNSVQVTSIDGGTGNTAAASLTVLTPPSITKSFGAATIPLNGSTSLSFTVNNPNSTGTLTGVAFTDAFPAGLVVSTPNALSGTCGGGTITATAGASSVSLSGASLAASASCTFSVNVTGTIAGVKNNSVQVTSTGGGTGNTATAGITVIAPPSIQKSFGATEIAIGAGTILSFTVTNPNGTIALSDVAFTDTLPAGLVVSTPNGLTGSCGGGTIAAAAGSSSVSLSNASLGVSASCTFSVNVTGVTSGVQNNSVTVSSTNAGTGNTATASVTVAGPPSISKSFGAAAIGIGGTTGLTFIITNPNSTVALTGVAFTDTLPSGLAVATPNGLTNTCCGGTATAAAGSGNISLTGGTVASGNSCTLL